MFIDSTSASRYTILHGNGVLSPTSADELKEHSGGQNRKINYSGAVFVGCDAMSCCDRTPTSRSRRSRKRLEYSPPSECHISPLNSSGLRKCRILILRQQHFRT